MRSLALPKRQILPVALGLLGCVVLATGGQFLAQVRVTAPSNLELPAGKIIEFLTVTDHRGALYSWVATRENDFVEAGRTQNFRLRPTLTGVYTIQATASLEDNTEQAVKNITLTVVDRQEQTESEEEPFGENEVVRTKPPLANNSIVLSEDSDMLQLYANPNLEQISIDLNTDVDTDGDGETSNDNDIANTLLASEKLPLYIWFGNGGTRHIKAWSGDLVQTIELESQTTNHSPESSSSSSSSSSRQSSVRSSYSSNRPYQYQPDTLNLRTLANRGIELAYPLTNINYKQVVYHWSFGDGTQSLETVPTHIYSASGTYNVGLTIRNMLTGEALRTESATVVIQDPPPVAESSSSVSSVASVRSSEASSVSSSSSAGTSSSGNASELVTRFTELLAKFGSLWPVILVFLVIIVLTGAIILIIRRLLRRGSGLLRRSIATAESKLMDRPDLAETDLNAAPAVMELKRPRETKTEVVETTPAPVAETVVPPWLQGTPAPAPAPASTETAAAAPIDTTTVPPWMQNVAPASEPEKTPAPVSDSSVPPWLQSAPAQTATPTSEPTPAETSVPPWLQSTTPAQATSTSNEPVPSATDVPPWMQTIPAATEATVAPAGNTEPATESAPPWLAPSAPAPEPAPTTPEPVSGTEVVPPWLQAAATPSQSSADTAPITDPVITEPVPSTAVPTPSEPTSTTPVTPSTAVTPDTPDWMKDPAPTVEQTAPAVASEAPTPVPVVSTQVAPEPSTATPVAAPASASPVATTTELPQSAEAAKPTKQLTPEQLEREKERKRLKRLRYRENQKKRKDEERKTSASTPITTTQAPTEPQKVETETILTPSAPTATEVQKVEEATPAAPITPVETPIIQEVATLPASTASVPPSEGAASSPAADTPDNQVAFVVRAEGLENPPPSAPTAA